MCAIDRVICVTRCDSVCGGRVARQVGELSRNFEKLSQAQQSMEAKVDALQAQQETIIQMLKKLT